MGGLYAMNLNKIGWKRVDWMHPAQYMDQWRALANTIMNFHVP